MLVQQLTQDPAKLTGRLVITADNPFLPELISLASELALRENITTHGDIIINPPAEPPPPPVED